MARARNIKPSFFQNEELGELPALARLAFIGMWTIADFKGCIEFRPKRLKVQLLPYDDCDLEEIAAVLDNSGFIRIYSVQGQRYIKIVNFDKHQNPHKNEREAGSEIPDIHENDINNKDLQKIEINPEQDGTAPADSLIPRTDSLLPDSRFLIPDSGFPNPPSTPVAPDPAAQGRDAPRKPGKSEKPPPRTAAAWAGYSAAYCERYGVEPLRNAKVNGILARLVERIPAEEVEAVAGFFVRHNKAFYVSKKHPVELLLQDAEGLRTEWVTGRMVTDTEARQADKTQATGNAFAGLIAEARERERTANETH